MPHLYFVFLDGVGLGTADPAVNPLARLHLPAFERLAGGQRWTARAETVATPSLVFRPLDATLGVEGLPQSGTGQATLFTGINCARVAGRHYGPYPHSRTKPVLARHNLFRRLTRLGLPYDEPAAFVNAYPPRFFETAEKRGRWTVTTRCCLDAGLRIRTLDDVLHARALTADLTGITWRTVLGHDVPPLSEAGAGRRLAHLGRQHALVLFEYFLTDKAGHRQNPDEAAAVLQALDRFLSGLLATFDPSQDLLLLTSDHGNLEDLSTRTHTRHPVPLVACGHGAGRFAALHSIEEVTPAVVEAVAAAHAAAG
ncbi:peptidase [Rhodocaloribacter litoris]|uniref:peptidase n=1 Tax=Rhodocaloribacter litoris TaxID=2558931 RepID=UPI001420CE4B|nr:peptidase [Rhodocaloribacter litoris]QXD14765.1 peptidase [Rhodocaloribacter litoris]GIV59149.1 MAG: peptidase [Rhodothermaceae bacterium]